MEDSSTFRVDEQVDPRPRGFVPILRSFSRPSSRTYGDRFIPNRARMDISQTLLMAPTREENSEAISPSKEAYRKLLVDALFGGRTRIFSFCNQPYTRIKYLQEPNSSAQLKHVNHRRQIPKAPVEILDLPKLRHDYDLNLLDWGGSDVVSIALCKTVYLWNATNGFTSELVTVDDEHSLVTSVSWAPDGRHIAIGLDSSQVQIWDTASRKLVRTLRGIHRYRVGSLAWNNYLLTTGSWDNTIVINDVRVRDHAVGSYCGHRSEVCNLKWSESGTQLASGGKDGLLNIWELSTGTQLHRLNHRGQVKAIDWCPYQRSLLASGESTDDGCIKLWDVNDGTCIKSVGTGSEVSALLWNKKEKQLLSSHWGGDNQLMLWKHPSIGKMAELSGDSSGVLFMAESPNGCAVASVSGDEKLRVWNIFGDPKPKKAAPKTKTACSMGPTNQYSYIR